MELHIGRHSSMDGEGRFVYLDPVSESRMFDVPNSEVSDAVPPLSTYYDFPMVFLKPTPDVLDPVNIMNITPELESLLGVRITQFINKFHAELTGPDYDRLDSSFDDMFNLPKFIEKQFFMTAQIIDGIKRYDGVTAKEFSELFSRYETSLLKDCKIRSQMLKDCIIRSQMLDASSPIPMSLKDCIQGIQKGPIQTELIKTFAQPETGISFMQEINLDCAKQGAAIVVSYVLSSSKPGVVLDVTMFALLMGISCSMLAHLLRKHEPVSKVLTKIGLMGIASSVILSFAALFPQRWSSPIPYLFVGLGLMLGAIALALIILACSYRKSASTDHDDEEESQKKIHDLHHEEMEPRVVIMAGDTNPTQLATPVAATRFSTEKV